jgi:hypothetical protein
VFRHLMSKALEAGVCRLRRVSGPSLTRRSIVPQAAR